MPFKLRNAEATYHRLVNKFVEQIQKTIEVHVEYMVVKSLMVLSHLAHLEEVPSVLEKYKMKLTI